jgi:hypothetical protein
MGPRIPRQTNKRRGSPENGSAVGDALHLAAEPDNPRSARAAGRVRARADA